jgi:hypothetical protein
MEQSCYKCGQLVEEGRPFCPHCAAPQIRVLMPESAAAPLAFPDGGTAPIASAHLPAAQTVPVLALPMSWSDAAKPCALAALVATILMALGLHPFVAMLSVGLLAVVFYRQRRPEMMIKPTGGARLGALSGLLWFAMTSILEAVVVLVLHKGADVQKQIFTVIDQASARANDPQMTAVFDWFKTPGGLEFLMIFIIVFGFISAVLLAAVGGALGGMVLGRRNRA